jgi:hypothetical protein
MTKNMKKTYRMFKRKDRGNIYYIQENGANNPRSLAVVLIVIVAYFLYRFFTDGDYH